MRNEFCTTLDINYLPRALVLYRSLAEVCGDFRLRVFCMDDDTRAILERMALPKLVTVGINELENYDPDLSTVKPIRNSVEYCWTAKPSICLYMLESQPDLDIVTYVEADTMFFDNPRPLFDELGDSFAILTPARDPESDGPASYATPFLPLRRDARTEVALQWWRQRCLEWCYDRFEDGKHCDLAYLNEWPVRFPGVAVLENPGCLGEWNVRYFDVSAEDDRVLVEGRPLILFHYGALWLYRGALTRLPRLGFLADYYRVTPGPLVWATANATPAEERRLLWDPYLRRLGTAIEDLRAVDPSFDAGLVQLSVRELAYSTARWALPASVRRPLKASLSRRRSVRGLGPPGSPQ
jgi:hypothetical protein